MKKIIFVFIVLSLLVLSGCSGITGKGVADSKEKPVVDERITECVKLCNDGSKSEEEFYNSCSKILEFGGEEVFNNYLKECKGN